MRAPAAGLSGINTKYSRPTGRRSPSRPCGGVSVLELILVVAMMLVLAAMTAPFMATAVSSRSLDRYSAEASDALREAQFSSAYGRTDGAGGSRFGVHFESGKFVFFAGAAYVAGGANNTEHVLADGVTVFSVTLSGGGSDVHFNSARGLPAETGTVVLKDPNGNSKTVTIGAAGMIDIN